MWKTGHAKLPKVSPASRSLLRFLFRIARPATAATAPSVAVCDDVVADVVAGAGRSAEVAGVAVTAGAVTAAGRTKDRAMVTEMGCR